MQIRPSSKKYSLKAWLSSCAFVMCGLTLYGCDIATLPGAETVRISYQPALAQGCKPLGPIDTGHLLWIEDKDDAHVDQKADLQNTALIMGGNTVIIPPPPSSPKANSTEEADVVAAEVYLCTQPHPLQKLQDSRQ